MLGRSECILLKSLLEMARPRKGGTPTFTAYHAARALGLLEGERMGRQRLARLLGLGEASTRTLLEIMSELGLVEKAGRGFQTTGRGRELAATLSRVLKVHTGTANPIPGGGGHSTPEHRPPRGPDVRVQDKRLPGGGGLQSSGDRGHPEWEAPLPRGRGPAGGLHSRGRRGPRHNRQLHNHIRPPELPTPSLQRRLKDSCREAMQVAGRGTRISPLSPHSHR